MRHPHRQIARRSVAVAGVAALVLTTNMAGSQAQRGAEPPKTQSSAPLRWTQTPTGHRPATLDAVDSHAGVTWAVGSDLVDDFADIRPFALRWQNGKWQTMPRPMRTNSTLNSVAVAKADDVWAVGENRADPNSTKPLVVHWNGTAWKIVPGPAVPTGSFGDVKVAADGSIWATGWANVGGREHAVVYRYNGTSWTALNAGLEGSVNGNNLAVLSKNDAWLGLNGGLAHFDGSSWRLVASVPASAASSGLAVAGPDDIWFAAVDHDSGVPVGSSLLMHYDGTSWTRIEAPPGSTQLYGVALRSGRPIAVGESVQDSGGLARSMPLVLEYNGSKFVEAKAPTATEGTLTDVAVAGSRLWTVGLVYATPTELAAAAAYAD